MKFIHSTKNFPKARRALKYLYDKKTFALLYGGGAGGGKSWIGVEWITAMCLLFGGVRYFISRNELKKLKQSTFVTFKKVCKHHGISSDLWQYKSQESLIRFYNGSEILFMEVKRNPSDPDFEDLGSMEFTGGFMEECAENDFGAFDTLKSRVGRHLNTEYGIPPKIFLTCNPKKNWVYTEFYKKSKEGILQEDYIFLQSLYSDNPHTAEMYEKQLNDIKDPVKRARLKDGDWEYEDNEDCIYNYDDVLDMFDREPNTGTKYLTCDVARYGDDKTVIGSWNGYDLGSIETMDKSGVDTVAKRLNAIRGKEKVLRKRVAVDEDGVGGGVVDITKCQGIVHASRPIENGNYQNLRTELAFKFREIMPYVSINATPEQKELITQEFMAIFERDKDKDGKIKISTREQIISRINRSPDYWSMIIQRAYFELKKNVKMKMYR